MCMEDLDISAFTYIWTHKGLKHLKRGMVKVGMFVAL